MGLNPVDIAAWQAGQRRLSDYRIAQERQWRELAADYDPIAALMRLLEQRERREVRLVDVDDCELLPFDDPREVTG